MFGYVKPVVNEMLVKEHEFYKATYCGICRAMKKHTGTLSSVTLSYDSIFLALLRMLYIEDKDFSARNRRCIAHPLKKRPMLDENSAIEYTARAFAVLTYYKLRDDFQDERGAKRAAVAIAKPIAEHASAKAELDALSEIVSDRLGKIDALEKAECASVDEPAALFGELLGEIFAYGLAEGERLVPYEVGYHLGKFIYAADAAEDYDSDVKKGRYNPYALLYKGAPLTRENRESIKCGLLLECKRLESAVNLLPFGTRATIENIINNIIYLGLVKRIEFLDKNEEKTTEVK
ncbi:MAG: hypothetical protein E7676_04885 [Ruminococcaceae bacterium]|nr:hypothetical protein [Oscillospiraceae bacterium]